MKVRRRVETLEAQQFFPDQKPWPEYVKCLTVEIVNTNNVLEKSSLKELDTPIDGTRCWFAFVGGAGHLNIYPGDWVLTTEEGSSFLCSNKFFEERYIEVVDSEEKQ